MHECMKIQSVKIEGGQLYEETTLRLFYIKIKIG